MRRGNNGDGVKVSEVSETLGHEWALYQGIRDNQYIFYKCSNCELYKAVGIGEYAGLIYIKEDKADCWNPTAIPTCGWVIMERALK